MVKGWRFFAKEWFFMWSDFKLGVNCFLEADEPRMLCKKDSLEDSKKITLHKHLKYIFIFALNERREKMVCSAEYSTLVQN